MSDQTIMAPKPEREPPINLGNAANYMGLFGWPKTVQPGSLNDNTAPFAYANDLYELATTLEAGADTSRAQLLAQRRSDIGSMPMDERSLKKTFPALRFAIDRLEETIRKSASPPQPSLREAIARAAYPASLPFHFAWAKVKAVLKQRKLSIWDVVRRSDADFPNFTFGNVTSTSLRCAMTLSSGFSPDMQALLVAPLSNNDDVTTALLPTSPSYPDTPDEEPTPAIAHLGVADTFRQRLGLSRKELRQLLGVYQPGKARDDGTVDRQAGVKRSSFVTTKEPPVTGTDFGAAFINHGGEALYLRYTDDDENKPIRIEGLANEHVDRILRVLRLHHATKLSFSDIDVLVTTASRAEVRAEGDDKQLKLTATTLRAFGLFQHLREKYAVTAEQFATFIGNMPVSACGRERPFYDTLFNPSDIDPSDDSESVFTIDDTPFDPAGKTEADALAVRQLSQALRADESMVRWALERVDETQKKPGLTRSLPVVSACYRLIVLPRLLGLKSQEAVVLLTALNRENPKIFEQLAGQPTLDANATPVGDALSDLSTETFIADGSGLGSFLNELEQNVREDAFQAHADALYTHTDALDVIALVMNAAEWAAKHRRRADVLCLPLLIPTPTRPDARRIDAMSRAATTLAGRKEKGNDDDIVSAMIQYGLQLKDPALAPHLLTWSGHTLEQQVERLRALSTSPKTIAAPDGSLNVAACLGPDDFRLWTDLERHAAVAQLFGLSAVALAAMIDDPAIFNLSSEDGDSIRLLDFTTLYQISRYRDWLASLPADSGEDRAIDYFRQVRENRSLTSAQTTDMLARVTGWPKSDIQTIARRIESKTVPNTLEDLRDIDLAMRLRELALTTGLSIDALYDLNALKSSTQYAAFETAATAFSAACSEEDAATVEGIHGEGWRDALVAWMLHSWVPNQPGLGHINDAEALSDHLLTDVMIGPEPVTSWVASTMASLQTYIHRMLTGLEPGHDANEAITDALRDTWNESQSQYGRWRLLRQLKNYPENRIDPTRRRRATKAFSDLQSLLAQGKFSGDDIEAAILTYMTTVEANCNTQPISAYHDGVDPLKDTYHFIGKSNVSPPQYYWCTLDMSLRDANDAASMLGFTPWEEISVPLNGVIATTPLPPAATKNVPEELRPNVDTIRPVVIDGRRYVVWVERDTTGIPMGKDQKVSPFVATRACYCYQQLDGLWSPSNVLINLDGRDENGNFRDNTPAPDQEAPLDLDKAALSAKGNAFLKTQKFAPGLVVMVNAKGHRQKDPWLTVVLFQANNWWSSSVAWELNKGYFIASRDLLLLEEKQLDSNIAKKPIETALVTEWHTLFKDPRVVQHQYIGKLMVLDEQRPKKALYAISNAEAASRQGLRCHLTQDKLGTGLLEATLPEDKDFIELTAGFDGVWQDYGEASTSAASTGGEETILTFEGVYPKVARNDGATCHITVKADLSNAKSDKQTAPLDITFKWNTADGGPPADIIGVAMRLSLRTGEGNFVTNTIHPSSIDKMRINKGDIKGIVAIALCFLKIFSDNEGALRSNFDTFLLRSTLPISRKLTATLADETKKVLCKLSATTTVARESKDHALTAVTFDITAEYPDESCKKECGRMEFVYVVDSALINDGVRARPAEEVIFDLKTDDASITHTASISPDVDLSTAKLSIQRNEGMSIDFFTDCDPQTSTFQASGQPTSEALTAEAKFGRARLVLRGGMDKASARKIKLSAEDERVLARHCLAGLPKFAADSPEDFATFRSRIAVDPYVSDEVLHPPPAVSHYAVDHSYFFSQRVPVYFKVDNSKNAVASRRIVYEARIFPRTDLTIPADINVEHVIRLKREFPDTYNRFMASTTLEDNVLAEMVVTLNGDDMSRAVSVQYPVNLDVTEYTFELDVYAEDDTEALGTIIRTFKLKDKEAARRAKKDGESDADSESDADDAIPSTKLIQNIHQVHYLDMSEVNAKARVGARKLPVDAIRLNTLLGMRFAALATQSSHRLIDWDTQNLIEPRLQPGDKPDRLDFGGANGLYFWELFFHVPMLVAWQLRSTRHFREAFQWCTRHLFDPYDSAGDLTASRPPFWRDRPLADLRPALAVNEKLLTQDVDELAYADPERYRKAAFMFLIDSWRQEGDDFYRQLTRDDVNEATHCYRKALRLIGPLPEQLTVPPAALPTLSSARRSDFLPPVNVALTDARDLLKNRLFNLRHGLTIDGKRMDLALYDEADDFDALGNGRTGMLSGSRREAPTDVPPYRFKHVLPIAKEAVAQLIDMGRQVFHNYEEEYNAGLGVLQQANLIKLSDFTLKLNMEALAGARAERETLLASKRVIEHRRAYHVELYDTGRNAAEIYASIIAATVPGLKGGEAVAELAKAAIKVIPRIFGTSNGNAEPSAFAASAEKVLELASDTMAFISDELRWQAEFDREMASWIHEAALATDEIAVIDRQLAKQDIEIRAATITVANEKARQAVMREEYTFMTTGFAIGPTYIWMIARLSDIYAAAYDAVMSLCLAAQDGWQYETGQFSRRFIKPGAWMDNWRGMLAGDALQRDLLEMEAAYLRGRQRRMHIRKSVSLVDIMKIKSATLGSKIERDGEITFQLPSALYDADFPGHYLRQIVNVSVSFKFATSNEVRSIAAVLTQTRNDLLFEPDIEGAKQLYGDSEAKSNSVKGNLRHQQRVAVSTTKPIVDIDGYSGLFSLLFGDDRYLPFEGTGAISNWTLSFPGDREELLGILKRDDTWLLEDILLTVDYTADDGGTDFADAVRALRKSDAEPLAVLGLGSDEPRPLTFAAPRVIVGKIGIYVAIAPQPRLPGNSAVIVSYKMADGSIVDMPAQSWNGKGVNIPIEPAMIASHAGESLEVSYKVFGEEPTTSPSTPVKLPTAAQLLISSYPRPCVTPDLVKNALDRRDAPDGAIITVKPWAYIQKGQAIWMRCQGTKADDSREELTLRTPPEVITEQEVKDGVRVTIPLSDLDKLGDFAQLRIVLKVGLSGSDNEADAETFPGLTFDLPRCATLRVRMEEVSEWISYPDPLLSCDYAYVATSAKEGPTSLSLNGTAEYLNVQVVDANGKKQTLRCRLGRRVFIGNGFGEDTAWDRPSEVTDRDHLSSTTLRAVVRAEHNRKLPFGTYQGHATVQLMGWQVPRVRESIRLEVDATHAAPDTPLAPTPKPAPSPVPTPKPAVAPKPAPVADPKPPPSGSTANIANLPRPVLAEVLARNALDCRDIKNGGKLTVAAWPTIQEGQRIWLRCQGTKQNGSKNDLDLFPSPRTVTKDEVSAGLSVTLPYVYLNGLGTKTELRIVLKVALHGGDDEASAVEFPTLSLDIPRITAQFVDGKKPVLHISPATPGIGSRPGYLAISNDEGPTSLAASPPAPTLLSTTVVDDNGRKYSLKLRGTLTWAGEAAFGINHSAVTKGGAADNSGESVLCIEYLALDNPDLPQGRYYTGHLVLQEVGPTEKVVQSLLVEIGIKQ
ncbi:neuraminidase-like domain-containing protein [Luteibacter sp. dw_328]|uniref:Tc toxin subunit A-related protein n=1 Tax=Luteibacter sp. dw_328 TaxID=2719796 RepID=UPI001BD611AD|nr:neuraminidase-like domain-containing protein [Luteibacter sp. dw_328]